MSKMNENSEKILRIIHISAMSVWFSSLLIMSVITFLIAKITSYEALKYAHEIVSLIDRFILTPAAILTLLTGIVFINFTQWKLKDNLWLKIKVLITCALILSGIFYLAPLLNIMIDKILTIGVDALTQDTYQSDLSTITWFMITNCLLLLFVIIISTFKPGKETK